MSIDIINEPSPDDSIPMLSGLVITEQSGFYQVVATDAATYVCRLRGRLKEEAQTSDIAAIGDRVHITPVVEEGMNVLTGIIESIEPRTSVLSRAVRTTGNRGVGQAEREQIVIANADQALLVFSIHQPVPNFRMLDRLLVACEKAAIRSVAIVVNKVDLAEPGEWQTIFAPYLAMGYDVLPTSTVAPFGIEALRERLADHISVFTGSSGVGKSSLLNAIQPDLARQVKAVSNWHQAGVHTTRDSVMVPLEHGGFLADTPGMRLFNLWDVEPDELDGYFRDIAPFVDQCRFSNCTHTTEPGCAVKQAGRDGLLSRTRYENYIHLREELRATYIVYDR